MSAPSPPPPPPSSSAAVHIINIIINSRRYHHQHQQQQYHWNYRYCRYHHYVSELQTQPTPTIPAPSQFGADDVPLNSLNGLPWFVIIIVVIIITITIIIIIIIIIIVIIIIILLLRAPAIFLGFTILGEIFGVCGRFFLKIHSLS